MSKVYFDMGRTPKQDQPRKGWFMSMREAMVIANCGTVIYLTTTNKDGVAYKVGPFADRDEANWWLRDSVGFINALIATGGRSFSIVPVTEEAAP